MSYRKRPKSTVGKCSACKGSGVVASAQEYATEVCMECLGVGMVSEVREPPKTVAEVRKDEAEW